MENVKDWCISRQLWWGHRIPVYYLGESNDFVVAESMEKAIELAKEKTGKKICASDLRQDEDVLDTWFSSWLWPISVFDGINNPENEDINYYYPTNDLVSGPDILFFWIARMIIAGYEYKGKKPFNNVYLTGIVRDDQRRKMSKSLGNSPDPLLLIDKYGADGIRVGMLLCSPAGGDLLFDESLPEQGRNFTTKVWNAFRLVKSWEIADTDQPKNAKLAIEWFENKLNKTAQILNEQFDQYRISEALMTVYTLFWDDFCSWFLEAVKPSYGCPVDNTTYKHTVEIFEKLTQLLHPFMPFITEEIWQLLKDRKNGESIMVSIMPEIAKVNESILKEFELAKEVTTNIRSIRKGKNIPFKDSLELKIKTNGANYNNYFEPVISKLANIGSIESTEEEIKAAMSFIIKTVEYYIPVGDKIDIAEEIQKLEEELKYTDGFLKSVTKKLSNERFVNNAPEKVVETERKKQADAEAKIKVLKDRIANLA